MDEGTGENENRLDIPQGVEVLLDLGCGIVVAKVDLSIIREQDKNARLQKQEMFRQLTENIKRRNGLESLPFCALTDKVEIISGHHRTRAAKAAGLKEIYVLLDISGLNRSQIAAKQIAHNAIDGFDDQSVLKEIAKIITDVDDMIESFAGKEVLSVPEEEIEKLLSPKTDFDWKEIQFIFLPHQLEDLERIVKKTAGSKDYIGIAHVEQYERLVDALESYKEFTNIKNVGAAIHTMVEVALATMEAAEYDSSKEYLPINKIIGSSAIPSEEAVIIKAAIDKMKGSGEIADKQGWRGLVLMAQEYLNRG